jgi:hypothetical protein
LQNFFHEHNELIKLFKTAIEQMPSDNHKIVIRADKTPVGQHARRFNAPTIDEVVIVIVGEQFESCDTVHSGPFYNSIIVVTTRFVVS